MAGGIIKYAPVNGGTLISDFKSHFSIIRPRRTLALASVFLFIAFTTFLVFSPSSNSSSPWFTTPPDHSYRSQFSSVFNYFFSNSSAPDNAAASPNSPSAVVNRTQVLSPSSFQNQTQSKPNQKFPDEIKSNQSAIGVTKSAEIGNKTEALPQSRSRNQTPSDKIDVPKANQTQNQKFPDEIKSNHSAIVVTNSAETGNKSEVLPQRNPTPRDKIDVPKGNQTQNKKFPDGIKSESNQSAIGVTKSGNKNSQSVGGNGKSNLTSSLVNSTSVGGGNKPGMDDLVKSQLTKCDLFDGNWVRDESYPLYKPDSCSLIDEQFNCFLNGRPDNGYHKLRWKPKDCTLPRLDGSRMLELLRGKRLVFVGDSLNRNMWESLICILRNSVKNQKKVYEEFGRHHFRTEASYSFVFEDYKCTVEFFVTPFLVQEWELRSKNGGTQKETLRLDMVGRSADKYKNADIIVFNTGHWWTHEKTSLGKDYYQEGSHVYKELNVVEAFRKALTTWGRWVDANVNPRKSLVFFRGYSASHFSGGQWNSGGQCDHETEPIKNETYLTPYPQKMSVLEKVLKGMKTEVTYLNVTRMTDYRKDGHPSIYRKQHLSDEEKRSPLKFQDCSHWCLPGVPDAWNELLYAELLVKLNQRQQQKKP